MDLILSELKTTTRYNPNVKLGIVSATMDDDEPVYRAYYNNYSKYDNEFGLFTDPRIHISPPGKTTKYKITEHFAKDENNKDIHNRTIRQVREIIKNYPSGQILVFSTGQATIIKLVQELNKILPNEIITLPYYSSMNSIYKNIIKEVTKKLPSLKNKRSNVHLEWGEKFIEDKSVPNNIYRRAVIVATNVAEASITIPGLKFVVDNGYQKVSKYDIKQKSKIFAIEKISEASRLQRKGRVGRKESGDVFYLYPKGAREQIKPKFNITQEDFSDNLIKIFPNLNNFKKQLIPKIKENIRNVFTNYTEEEVEKKMEETVKEIIKQKIIDIKGIYYIVNPFEDRITRSFNNQIIKVDDKNTDKVNVDLYAIFHNNLSKNLMLAYKQQDSGKYVLDLNFNNLDNIEFKQTNFFRAVNDTSSQLMITKNQCIIVLLSNLIGISKEIYLLLPMINSLENGIKGLANLSSINGKIISNYKKLIKKFSSYNSDIFSIYKIVDSFRKNFSSLGIFKLLNDENDNSFIDSQKRIFNSLLKSYQKYKSNFKGKFTKNEYIDLDNYVIFDKLIKLRKYDNDLLFKEWLSTSTVESIFVDEFISNRRIVQWCDDNYVSYNSILIYYKKLVNFIIKIYSLDSKIDPDKNEINFIKKFASNNILKRSKLRVNYLNLKEKLELVFIYGYSNNLFYRSSNNLYYSFQSDVNVNQIINSYGYKLTFNNIMGQFISCVNKIDKGDGTIPQLNIIININPKILGRFLAPLFIGKNYNNKKKKKYRDDETDFITYQVRTIENSSLNNFYHELFNNLNIFEHLLYNEYIGKEDDEITVYELLKNLKT